MDVSIASAASPARTHPSRKELWRRREAPPPFWMGVWAGEAPDAMETSIIMHETCACMHITRNSCGYDLVGEYGSLFWF